MKFRNKLKRNEEGKKQRSAHFSMGVSTLKVPFGGFHSGAHLGPTILPHHHHVPPSMSDTWHPNLIKSKLQMAKK